jgi:putative protease
MTNNRIPELLAPAGNFAALTAAVEAGADAVYFGSENFNARQRAGNFTSDELKKAIELCHAFGVKSYITVNTQLYGKELDSALDEIYQLYLLGSDAFITADEGLAAVIRERWPEIELHASTQMSCYSRYDAGYLRKAGFSRMVCPRELTYDQIRKLCRDSPIDIEMFIHGAHCVSFSGQCLMSFVMGGRSGNRGTCAQPCRLPFHSSDVSSDHALSLKDMCLAGHIEEIMDLGVRSLKIEGRQKSADYVFGVVKTYRRLIDEHRSACKDEISFLGSLFSRDGFTDGYFTGQKNHMLGMHRGIKDTEYAVHFNGLTRKVPVDMKLTTSSGNPAVLTAESGGKNVQASFMCSQITGNPPDKQKIKENLSRLGNTVYQLHDCRIDTDGSFITLSNINSLRRSVIDMLSDCSRSLANSARYPEIHEYSFNSSVNTAEFSSPYQVPDSAEKFFDKIWVPEAFRSTTYSPKLEFFSPDCPELPEWILSCSKEILLETRGQLLQAVKNGLDCSVSSRLNIFNRYSAFSVLENGAEAYTVSPELSLSDIRFGFEGLNGAKSVIIYGKIPVMYTVKCAFSPDMTVCRKNCHGFCKGMLTDRRGIHFPAIRTAGCANIILNPNPIYMADKPEQISSMKASRLHFIFTDETKEECEDIIRRYEGSVPPDNPSQIRRIK